MAISRDELLSQALMGVAMIERAVLPERGELADSLLNEIKVNSHQYEDLKAMYIQLLYAATVLAANGADMAKVELPEYFDQLRGSMLAARFTALGRD